MMSINIQHIEYYLPEKIFINLNRVGNTVSSSIPIALKDAETDVKAVAEKYSIHVEWDLKELDFCQ